MHNDGTGPRYDWPRRPRTITRDEVRRPAPEPTDYERYQALLADGVDDAEARTTIWPDNALLYVEGEDGEDVLLPVGEDGFAIIPDDHVVEPDGDEETESTTGEAEEQAEDANAAPDAPTPDEAEIVAEEAAEPTGDDTEDEEQEEAEPEKPADAGYEPADHNRNEVQQYLHDNPDQAEYVLARERTGKARVSLIGA